MSFSRFQELQVMNHNSIEYQNYFWKVFTEIFDRIQALFIECVFPHAKFNSILVLWSDGKLISELIR